MAQKQSSTRETPYRGVSALHAYRQGFARGWLGLSTEHPYEHGSALAGAFLVGYRVGTRESLEHAPKHGAQSLRRGTP